MKRLFALLLLLALLCAQIVLPAEAVAEDIQQGVTLHCWNWSFKNIEANMAKIAAQGYTAIQTSPIQAAKQRTNGSQTYDWWVFYQPASFAIDNSGNSALGTKAQFKSMCDAAHKYGIKVIVDVVANHMGDNGGNNISSAVISDLRNDRSCWHDISKNTYDYGKRYDVTQWCMNGLPDLNTGNSKVQKYVLDFLKECIDCGADGFRFDAAKHIETPDDSRDNCASNFWPTVINGAKSYAKSKRGIDLYCYGELLDNPGGSLGIGSYTKYMSVTDNAWSNQVREQVVGGNNAGNFGYSYYKDAKASKLVLWAESHDTYTEGSSGMNTQYINKTWALIAARADAMGLYLARPNGYTQKLGTASVTGWANKEVAAVNKFHTAFAGKSEYVSNENGIAYVERGDSGVVLVNCGGSNSVNVSAHTMKDGTYTDQITGSTFTVSGGRIKGTIGSTGIAVVYKATPTVTPKPETKIIYFTGDWSKVNVYAWYEGPVEITSSWPGDAMKKNADGVWECSLPADTVNIIFNDGSSQTEDLAIPSGKNCYDLTKNQWTVYQEKTPVTPVCRHSAHNQDGNCTACGVFVGHNFESGKCACGATNIRCAHGVHDTNGICTGCGIAVAHKYVDGTCSCGLKEAVTEPTTQPTEPTTQPTEPTTEPTQPSTEPTTVPDSTEPSQEGTTTVPTTCEPSGGTCQVPMETPEKEEPNHLGWIAIAIAGILLCAGTVVVVFLRNKNNK